MGNFETWQLIVGAIAVPCGLWLLTEIFLPWYRSPKLTIKFGNTEPFCQKTLMPIEDLTTTDPVITDMYWIRILIQNQGSKTARNVHAQVIKIWDSKHLPRQITKPLELYWSQTNIPSPRSLAPQEKNFLDVFAIPNKYPEVMWIRAGGSKHECGLKRGTYFLKIEIYVEDAKPVKRIYRIEWIKDGIESVRMRRITWFDWRFWRLSFQR